MRPNLFVIGAPKAGTTTIVNALGQHPEIFVPATKEPRFFDARTFFDYKEDYPHSTIDSYLRLYNVAEPGARYWVDGSVFNMYSMESIREILEFSPDARFIVVLRDPLEATKSMFRQRMKTLYRHLREIDENFYACWDVIEQRRNGVGYPEGCRSSILFRYDLMYRYELYLPDLMRELGDRLLVSSFESLVADADAFYARIFAFLAVQPFSPTRVHLNESTVVRRTRVAKLLYAFANSTFDLRRRIAPRSRVPPWLRSRLLPKQQLLMIDDPEKDAEIRGFFADTYRCMAEITDRTDQVPK